MHYMQTATESSPAFEKAELFAEDARVHCVVLKIRTEPCIANLHTEVRDDRPFEESPKKRLLPQDPTACSPRRTFRALVRLSRKRAAYWPRFHAPT